MELFSSGTEFSEIRPRRETWSNFAWTEICLDILQTIVSARPGGNKASVVQAKRIITPPVQIKVVSVNARPVDQKLAATLLMQFVGGSSGKHREPQNALLEVVMIFFAWTVCFDF